jgi:hypothetical protein
MLSKYSDGLEEPVAASRRKILRWEILPTHTVDGVSSRMTVLVFFTDVTRVRICVSVRLAVSAVSIFFVPPFEFFRISLSSWRCIIIRRISFSLQPVRAFRPNFLKTVKPSKLQF